MSHVTPIGLDVHTRSVTAVTLDSLMGEVRLRRFGYSPAEVAAWVLGFESPKAVYESGATRFRLMRPQGDGRGLRRRCDLQDTQASR